MITTGKRRSNQNEVKTHNPAATGFERFSSGSGVELQHNFPGSRINQIMNGSIRSVGGSDDLGRQYINPIAVPDIQKQDSKQSFMSSASMNDGGPVELDKILKGEETRTNIMVKNIPCKYTYNEVKQDFEKNHKNHWNNLRLPLDKSSPKTNKAYCFINMRHVLYVYDFIYDKKNYHWPKYSSDKTVDISFAKE